MSIDPPNRALRGGEIVRRDLTRVFLSIFCTATTLAAVLPVLPLLIRDSTGETSAAGAVTGAIAAGAVAFELSTPWFLRRAPSQSLLVGGLLVIGIALASIAALHSILLMAVFGFVFGAGFGVNVTVVSAFVGRLGSRRGNALGMYGLVVGVPTILAPPLALFMEERVGARAVLVTVALVAVVGILPLQTVRVRQAQPMSSDGLGRTVRNRGIIPVVVAYVLVTATYGAVVSFTPFVLTGDGVESAAMFLFLFGLFRTLARAAAGPMVTNSRELAVTCTCLLAIGVGLALIGSTHSLAVIGAAFLYGVGYGITQTGTFVALLGRASANVNEASSLWNLAVDGGTGLGALTLAPVGAAVGYRTLFFLLPLAPGLALATRLIESRRREPRDVPIDAACATPLAPPRSPN